MKILIGTPIHFVKEYSMRQWLENVANLQKKYPTDLLAVDNSIGPTYVETVKKYCQEFRVQNFKIVHIELPPEQRVFERVNRAREIIRKEVLEGGYDAWFSWECDQIIPVDALDKLVQIMELGKFSIVNHNGWGREEPENVNTDFGVSLIDRASLEKYSFILEKFGRPPDLPSSWEVGEVWFKTRVLRGGGSFVEVMGAIAPIYHLENAKNDDATHK